MTVELGGQLDRLLFQGGVVMMVAVALTFAFRSAGGG